MTPHSDAEVVREIEIEAPPEAIFSYLTDPAKLVLWMGAAAQLDPRPGGLFSVQINPERVVRGEYLEVTPFSRLVLSWGWEGREDVPPGSSTVEITLTSTQTGTRLRLRHHNLPSQAMPLHAKSWEHNLPRLKTAVEKDRGSV